MRLRASLRPPKTANNIYIRKSKMKTLSLTLALTLGLTTLHAQQGNPVVVKQVVSTSVNSSG